MNQLSIDYKLTMARNTRKGDKILFDMPGACYTVEAVDTDALGRVRHLHSDGMASSCYEPGEYLCVKNQQDPITAYYADKQSHGQPPALPR